MLFTKYNRHKLTGKKDKPLWLAAPFVTLIGMLLLYYLNGVTPFGTNSIASYDLLQATYPSMNYVWDIFHGNANLHYDFQVACGYGRNIFSILLQPQYLFAALFPRDKIYDSISYLMIIKYVLVALSASYSFKKIFPKLSYPWVNTLALMYTFCGFNILYCTNIDWLDTMALFPLIIVGMLRMFKTSNKTLYYVSLSILLLIATYMSWFVILSLIIFGGMYILIVSPKEQKAHNACTLGVATVASLITNAYQVYLLVKTFAGGSRFARGSFYSDGRSGASIEAKSIFDIFNVPNDIDICCVFMFLGTGIAFASLILMWAAFKKHRETRRYTVFFTASIILFVLEVCITATLLLWHGGSYQFFPYRNGFTVMFMCCLIVGYFNTELEHFGEIKFKNRILNLIPFIALFFLTIGLLAYFGVFSALFDKFHILTLYTRLQAGVFAYSYFWLSVILISTFLVIKTISIKALKNAISIILVTVTLAINMFNITKCTELSLTESIFYPNDVLCRNDIFERIYNQDTTLGYNAYYLGRNSGIANWTPAIYVKQVEAFKALGFQTSSAIIDDSGATKFTKALLHITDLVSKTEINDYDYSLTGKSGNFLFYKNKHYLPFGFTADKKILNINPDEYENTFEYQEAIYEALTDDNGLFVKIDNSVFKESFKEETYFENKTDEKTGEKYLDKYTGKQCTLNAETDTNGKYTYYVLTEKNNAEITVNAKSLDKIKNVTKEIKEACRVPVEIGTYENEKAEIIISIKNNNADKSYISLYAMDCTKLKKLCESYTSDEYTVNGTEVTVNGDYEKGKLILLPLSYSEKWTVSVNGKTVTPYCVLGNFIGIEATDGKSTINLSYSHSDFNYSVILCISFLIIGFILFLTEKKHPLQKNTTIKNTSLILLAIASSSTIIVLYIIPLICTLKNAL